jgi:hypothetical protein
MPRPVSTKTIQTTNGIYEIIATNPIKEFTIPGIKDELKAVYGIDTQHAVVWRTINALDKANLVSLQSTVSKTNHYSVVSSSKISELIDTTVGFPKAVKPGVGINPNDSLVSEPKVEGKIKDQDFDPMSYLEEKHYNHILRILDKNNVETSKEMIIVVAAIMGYCHEEQTTQFSSKEMFVAINFLSKMTILCKLEKLCNAFFLIRPEQREGKVGYRITMIPLDYNLNMDNGCVLRPLEALSLEESDLLISDVDESPEEKVSGVTLTSEEIGDGFIAIYKRVEADNANLLIRLEEMVRENAVLRKENSDMKEAIKDATIRVVSLTSKNEELMKEKGLKPKSKITLRSMQDLKQVKVGM